MAQVEPFAKGILQTEPNLNSPGGLLTPARPALSAYDPSLREKIAHYKDDPNFADMVAGQRDRLKLEEAKLRMMTQDVTRNFVVFRDELISIVKRYGLPGAVGLTGMSQADISSIVNEQ